MTLPENVEKALGLIYDHSSEYEGLRESADTLRAHIEAQAAEIERFKKQREWRPIETAPKDGSVINVYMRHIFHGNYVVREVHWAEDPYTKEVGWHSTDGDDYSLGSYYVPYSNDEPLGWMPLPTPPAQ